MYQEHQTDYYNTGLHLAAHMKPHDAGLAAKVQAEKETFRRIDDYILIAFLGGHFVIVMMTFKVCMLRGPRACRDHRTVN